MFAPIKEQWGFIIGAGGAAMAKIPAEIVERETDNPAGEAESEAAGATICGCPAEIYERETSTQQTWDHASTDEELVHMARRGDTEAFGELIKRHYGACLKRATFMVRNRSDAEDEVQNACWKAFQRLDQYRGEGTFSAWLGKIVENQCLMRVREERRSYFLYLDEASDSNVRLELVCPIAHPEDEYGEQQVVNLVRREISLIPPLLRNVMLLRDVQQLPMQEVASQLGLSVPAAKSRLMRARGELRRRVEKHCGFKGCGTLTQRSRYQQAAYCRAI
jgi:RNA polymerase sigma-70 factor, ECF subfamily